MFMVLVARCLERIGDNTVDIAEQTAFVVTGLFSEFEHAHGRPRLSSTPAVPDAGRDRLILATGPKTAWWAGLTFCAMDIRPRQIVAFGGGGFSMEWGNTLLDDFVLGLTGVKRPKVCFLPTASGDADHYVVRFYRAFSASRCEPSHISLFRRETGVGDPRAHLLSQDLIYVGGGSLVSLLGTWRAHGIDDVLREAWEAGVILCGGSAGALCWFSHALSGFHEGPARRSRRSVCCRGVARSTTTRRTGGARLHRGVGDGMPAGYGAGDSAALHFVGTELAEVVSSRPKARASFVATDAHGDSVEHELPVRYLGVSGG